MAQPCQGFDFAGPAGQHQAVDDSAGLGSGDRVAEPTLPASGKNPDVALEQIVVDGHFAVFDIARQIGPLVQGIGDGITEVAVRQNLRLQSIKPILEGL